MQRGALLAVFLFAVLAVIAWAMFDREAEARRLAERVAVVERLAEGDVGAARRSVVPESAPEGELGPNALVAGIVRDELTQRPVVGAAVVVLPFDRSYRDVLAEQRVDAKVSTSYFLAALRREPDDWHWIKVSHPDYLPVVRWVQPSQFDARPGALTEQNGSTGVLMPSLHGTSIAPGSKMAQLDVALWPRSAAATIACRVVDSVGRAVSSADVVLRGRESLRPTLGVAYSVDVEPDPSGAFVSEQVRPGPARLIVTADGFERLERELDLQRGRNELGSIVLATKTPSKTPEPARLRGTIADAKGGAAVGARVIVAPMTADRAQSIVEDDGTYEVEGIVPGTHEVRVAAGDRFSVTFTHEFAPGATVEFHYRFAGRHVIGGIVVDGGEPIEGLSVTATLEHRVVLDGKLGPESRRRWQVETDRKGRFLLEQLPPGPVDLVLRWSKSIYRDLVVRGLPVDRLDYRLRFPLPRSIEVSGVVRDANGAAIAEAELVPRYLSAADRKPTRSAANGAFRMSVAMSNQQALAIRVSRSGFRDASQAFLLSEAAPDGTIHWDPTLYRDGDLGEVTGTIRDAAGKPVPNAGVRARRSARSLITEQADSDSQGRYRLVEVAPGPIELEVRHRDYELWTKPLEIERGQKQTVDVELQPVSSAPLELGLVFRDAPLAGAKVTLIRRHPGRRADLEADARGVVRVDDWKSGDTEVIVAAANRYPSQRCRIRHTADAEPRRLEVRGGRGIVRGVLRTQNGHPVPSEIVVLREQVEAGLVVFDEVLTDQDGEFLFASLPRSKFTIDVANDAGTRREVEPDGRSIELRTRY